MNKENNIDNIIFSCYDTDCNKNNEEEIQKMMEEFNTTDFNDDIFSMIHGSLNEDYDDKLNMIYYITKNIYNSDESYYNEEYTIKDLLKICTYYGIEKNIKTSKCKKQDIISTIIYFESLPENFDIVTNRHRMWSYITELQNDPKTKKFIIF